MSTFTTTSPIIDPTTAAAGSITDHSPQRVWRVGLVAGVVASAATTVVAVLAAGAGVSLEIGGEKIPYVGFAYLTMIGTLIGGVMAAVLARRARRPRSTFVRAAVALTVLSLLPDVIANADVATRLTLGVTHVVAAAIVVPVIAHRLAR